MYTCMHIVSMYVYIGILQFWLQACFHHQAGCMTLEKTATVRKIKHSSEIVIEYVIIYTYM
jgi:hypothetical protein